MQGEAGEHRTIGEALRAAVQRWGPRVALRRRREALNWSVLTWSELGSTVDAYAAGLLSLGVGKGDRVALLSRTRIEWTLTDLAVLSLGAVLVPIYHSSTEGQVRFLLQHSKASVLVLEDRTLLDKLKRVLDEVPDLRRVVLIEIADLRDEPRAIVLDELERDGRRLLRDRVHAVDEARAAVGEHDLATLVYTSGTTGEPKGAKLTHRALLAASTGVAALLPVGPDDTTVLCLPLSHIYPRLAQMVALLAGFCTAYAQRVDRLGEVLREVRPTFFFAVPRIYERIYHETVARYRDLPPIGRAAFRHGVDAARAAQGDGPTLLQKLGGRLADRAIFEPVREALGGRIRFCVTGGAPMMEDVARFFQLAGVEILEGYGLTESGGAGTLNPAGEARIGTVGRPLPGMRVRIAPDGEVLLLGDALFSGYYDDEAETAVALDDDGWLHTGDVGSFDDGGYLVISDRKKDLIVTSGAKNVAPQRVEGALRMSRFVADAMVFGDRRPFLVALLTLADDEIRAMAARLDLAETDWQALIRHPRVQELVQAEVDRCNTSLAPFEQVRRFRVLSRSLTVEGGELTPTLKVRRSTVEERYRPLIDAMYAELPPA